MASRKVAVVTGSNKGIGYAIVKGLCKKFEGDVYLTARNTKLGQAAVEKLKALGYKPLFHQLDISDQSSVDTFRDYLKSKHGGLDVLVNNAGIVFQADTTEPVSIQASETIRVNYYGTLRVCEALFPLLRQNGRVVNLSSSVGHSFFIKSANLREKLGDQELTVDGLNKLMDKFVQVAKRGKHKEEGWGDYLVAYNVSKVGISRLSMIQQKEFDAEIPNRNISVNSVHPGFIETDLTREARTRVGGAKPIEEGAKAPLFLALEANLKGKFVWEDSSVVDWYVPSEEVLVIVKLLESS